MTKNRRDRGKKKYWIIVGRKDGVPFSCWKTKKEAEATIKEVENEFGDGGRVYAVRKITLGIGRDWV